MPPLKGDDGAPSGFTPADPFGVWGDSGSFGPFGKGGNGVVGSSGHSSGVFGITLADQNRAAGVFGLAPRVGVSGYVQGAITAPGGKVGVYGSGSNGSNLGGVGVIGESDTSDGVSGASTKGVGIRGLSTSSSGVIGVSSQNVGVFGVSNGTGVIGWGGTGGAGRFFGNVDITGTLTKGGGGFRIDHPLEPENKYLNHSFVESPEMKNLYDGIAVCNEKGEAVVELPKWFETLNTDFRYQLTPIGAPGPNLYVAAEVKNNRFTIGGGAPKLKVSWQVTGVRQDPWAKEHRIVAEEEKQGDARGRFLHPELHTKETGRGIGHEHIAAAEEALRQAKK